MINILTRWETTTTPAVAIEPTDRQTISVFWGAIVPAVPDLLSLEQARTGMNYETALNLLLQAQQRWVQQLHGDSRFTISLRIITTGDPDRELVLGIIGRTEGKIEAETVNAARNFFNKIRDTFPNGYPLQPCSETRELALLRLPLQPQAQGGIGEFRRSITPLRSISSADRSNVGMKIDPWLPQADNFQDIFRTLTCHPAPAALAINLRPTSLTTEESNFLAEQADRYAKVASVTLSEGTQNRVLSSNTQFQEKLSEAEGAAQAWQKLQSIWQKPYEMTVSIISDTALPQSIVAALQSAVDGKSTEADRVAGGGEMAIAQQLAQKMAARQNWVDLTLHRWSNTSDLDRLPWLFGAAEVHSLFRLPIADRSGVWGLPSAPGANDARKPVSAAPQTADIPIGNLQLSKKQLTQHLLICGVPGSGKTNTSLYLLERLWSSYQIPWLVLEPAKTEYRGLGAVPSLRDDLLIFSLGEERVAPFRFNPFELPVGINLDSHQGALIDLFSVSMSMWGPLPNVVEQLIQEAYKRKGFTTMGDNSQLVPPCFSDVANLVSEIVPRLGYKKETTDEISAAISVRLNRFRRGGLGRMLDTTRSIPFDELMQKPVILEMSQITNSDDRAFIMGLLLNRCYQYWTARRHEATGELKHLLLVEEAHNLLGKVAESGDQETANPKAKAVKNFANMLAEVRGFGQGIAIAEQNPDGLVADVMVNTNTKLAHRTVEGRNREALGRSMLLTPQQEKSLASLSVGQMLYYVGGSPEPSVTACANFKDNPSNGFNPRLRDEEIERQFQTFKNRYAQIYAPPSGCPIEPQLAACIERGSNLVQILSEQPKYQGWKEKTILQLLAVPFGYPVRSIRHTLGSLLLETGANHLQSDEIVALIDSSLSFLATEAVQEKGKIHGWLGKESDDAQRLLVRSLEGTDDRILVNWIDLCKIPDRFLQMGLPHPEYLNVEAPGVFRYENSIALESQAQFRQEMGRKTNPHIALENWGARSMVFPYLTPALQQSLITCLGIQLTRDFPTDLDIFLNKHKSHQ
jgi:DNA helicase HerA-like ATPase